jgi:uncharacterized small protein (DUF1192 family)
MTQSKTVFQIGEDLYGVSTQELEQRIVICEAEAARIRQELAKKQAELSAADKLFGQKP